MKYHVSKPALVKAPPVEFASAQVSYVQCTVLGEQFLPVRSEVPAPETSSTLFFSRTISETASATEEVGTSAMASTPSWSNQWRASAEPMSALFWWSAETTSIGRSLTRPPKSSAAIWVASAEP